MIAEIKLILKWDFTAVTEEEFVRLFAARKRNQRSEKPPGEGLPLPGPQGVNKDLVEVLERSESGFSRATENTFASEDAGRGILLPKGNSG